MSKIKISALVMISLLIFPFLGCNKYPDGPAVSLRTRTARIANTWKVETYKTNGHDYTSFYTSYVETFSMDGNYTYSLGDIAGQGKWNLQNRDAEIRITGSSNLESRVMIILKLEEKSFWYYYYDGDVRKEFHMVPALTGI